MTPLRRPWWPRSRSDRAFVVFAVLFCVATCAYDYDFRAHDDFRDRPPKTGVP